MGIGMAKSKNIEALVNNLTQRIAALDLDNNDTDSSNNNNNDHDYYLDRGMEPPRFVQYRLARARHKIGDTKTYQDVWDSITQDELDYYLKARLREPLEQRYQRIKKEWYFHELSYLHQTVDDNGKAVDIIKEYGCGHWSIKAEEGGCCVPECRYYTKYGRIEDDEVIADHNKWVESYRQRNAIVEPSTLLLSLSPSEQQRPYFQEHYDERDMP
jgi:hypothetical protein